MATNAHSQIKGTEQQLELHNCPRRSGKWELTESNNDYTLSWSIVKKTHTYKGGGKGKFDLCLTEKVEILKRARLKG